MTVDGRRAAVPSRPHLLMAARDPQTGERKHFVSNAPAGAPL